MLPYKQAFTYHNNPDSKVHGGNMGPIWGRQDPGGPHVVPMNFAIWEHIISSGMWCGVKIEWFNVFVKFYHYN